MKVSREGHPEAAMTPGRTFCSAPSLLSASCSSRSFGHRGGERAGTGKPFFSFMHSLTRGCRRWDRGGGGLWGQDRGEPRREVLNHRAEKKRGTSEDLHVMQSADERGDVTELQGGEGRGGGEGVSVQQC